MIRYCVPFVILLCCFQCPDRTAVNQRDSKEEMEVAEKNPPILTGADQIDQLLTLLKDKRVALLVNHTAMVGKRHLADTLRSAGVNLKKILAPEHGFRGTADAGELIKDGMDTKTGLPVVSLYGNNKKPTPQQLADVDVVVFDIQDVGARFYTYVSSMHYAMEACAEQGKQFIVLDRPNPNGHYIDGPILEKEQKTFVGMHPIPIVHGLTVGELAKMINGEGWLAGGKSCSLTVVGLKNWTHATPYSLPVKPSPNLPDDQSVLLYPSTCLFEGTTLSVGRGTQTPFQVIGHPDLKTLSFSFTPVSIEGMSKNPPHENKVCYGLDLRRVPVASRLDLSYVIQLYNAFPDKEKYFIPFFDKLAGTAVLRKQIVDGMSEEAIRKSWEPELEAYKALRKKYLIYE